MPNIGELILLRLGIAVPAAVAGFVWARFACRHEPRSPADASPEENSPSAEAAPTLPSPFRSFLPLVMGLTAFLVLQLCSLFLWLP
jgi:hypothetical protein